MCVVCASAEGVMRRDAWLWLSFALFAAAQTARDNASGFWVMADVFVLFGASYMLQSAMKDR